MQIHLCKPGGRRGGPYSLDQINTDLAAHRYTGSDYWAWHQGLPEWVPLYSLPGVQDGAPAKVSVTAESALAEAQSSAAGPGAEAFEAPAADRAEPAQEEEQLPSGMPFAALEHLFILSSGEGPTASRSNITAVILQGATGEELDLIRRRVTRDVIGGCDILKGLKGQTPGAIWQKMAAIRPELMAKARAYRICNRNFKIENGDMVCVFLFYSKQKL